MKLRFPPGLQFALLALTWGSSFLLIKVGLEGLSPGQVVLARMCCGSITLLTICAIGRRALPRNPVVWGHLLIVALLLCVIPFLLFAWAEQRVSSGLASIYNATTPLMTMVVAMLALPSEKKTAGRIVGVIFGFLGVVVLVAPWNGLGKGDLTSQLACLAATGCYGLAFTYLRRFVTPLGLPAVTAACVQVTLGALVMVLLSPIIATDSVHLSARVVLSMIALGALGTGLAYVWNTAVVNAWGATNASTVTYLTPVVGVVLGVLLLGEHVTWSEPMGALLVIFGIAITQGRITLPGMAARR